MTRRLAIGAVRIKIGASCRWRFLGIGAGLSVHSWTQAYPWVELTFWVLPLRFWIDACWLDAVALEEGR